MTEGWICPVCKRGVAPSEKHCDHGGASYPDVPIVPGTGTPAPLPTMRPPLTSDPLPWLPGTTCIDWSVSEEARHDIAAIEGNIRLAGTP